MANSKILCLVVDGTPLGAYADLRPNLPICQAFQEAMVGFGYQVQNNTTQATIPASTGQENFRYECPSWQVLGIPSDGAFPHTTRFSGGAGSEASCERYLLNIEGMAAVGYRVLTDDGFSEEVKRKLETRKWDRKRSYVGIQELRFLSCSMSRLITPPPFHSCQLQPVYSPRRLSTNYSRFIFSLTLKLLDPCQGLHVDPSAFEEFNVHRVSILVLPR